MNMVIKCTTIPILLRVVFLTVMFFLFCAESDGRYPCRVRCATAVTYQMIDED